MNLYLLGRKDRGGWNTYDSFVWCAETEKEAIIQSVKKYMSEYLGRPWVYGKDIVCKLIGKANYAMLEGEVLGSFNAG